MDCLRCSLTPSSSRPYWRARASMRAFFTGRHARDDEVLVGGEAEVPWWILAISSMPVLRGLPGKSSRRPFSINRVRWCLPSIPPPSRSDRHGW